MTISRKAKWLIVCATLYAVPSLTLIVLDHMTMRETGVNGLLWKTYGPHIQLVWLLVTGSPLLIRPLGNWVFKRKG